jgi:hypothetical protein
MVDWAARLLERNLRISNEQAHTALHAIGLTLAVLVFALMATVLVAADAIFAGGRNVSTLQIGDIAQQNIRSPIASTYTSDILTQRSREEAANAVPQVYDPPDANVLRNQTQLARQILDFIRNIRRDPFGTTDQKISDINQITALTLDDTIVRDILDIDDETWQEVDDQVVNVLERMMRESIREADLSTVVNQLPTQVSIRFAPEETAVVVAIVQDLIRPNTFPNPDATEQARVNAAEATESVPRTFARNEIVVREGKVIDAVDYEALERLGLLQPEEFRIHEVGRAFLSSVLVLIVTGLYIARFRSSLFANSRFTLTLVVIFLIALAGARSVGYTGVIYLYPTSAMALLISAIVAPQIAIIAVLGLALLTGVMLNNSLEVTVLVSMSGIIGALLLRRTERLSSFFLSGLIIGLTNILVVAVFNLGTISAMVEDYDVSLLLMFSLLNGLLSAALAIAGLYAVTLLFNLPTTLKLAELAQPSQKLLQRLLREAPGTYQHSLQVANLSEQAALAIGADSDLVRVAALYHDIGKMLNPAFFTENLPFGGGNPHDVLGDPYRSADIIISHVTDGDEMAQQNRLPDRLRDFIREHHGTTLVYVFYRQAVEQAGGDESDVDISEFTYPGPRPQTRETAIMMLADSCEAAVRSRGPANKNEISEIVQQIIDDKMNTGQLDESGIRLNDIKIIRRVFVEMLQAVFHPRINYPVNEGTKPRRTDTITASRTDMARIPASTTQTALLLDPGESAVQSGVVERPAVEVVDDDDDSPMPEVPMLPRTTGEHRAVKPPVNGKPDENKSEVSE